MKCLIIAAGHGSRLRSLSESKPLAPVGGVPLIEHVITRAKAGGASEFLVVTGHQGERVEAFLADLSARLEVPIAAARTEDWNLPNGYSVATGAALIEGDYLLTMSDHLFDPEIVARLLGLRNASRGLILAVDRNVSSPDLDLDDATKVETAEDGAILRIGKRLQRFDAIDTGLFLATPALREAILASIAGGGSGSLSEGVQLLADRGEAQTMDVGSSWWADVDDPPSLRAAEEHLKAA
jgi:1L-myo-inositol 1-phosphate cytidylyltransferase